MLVPRIGLADDTSEAKRLYISGTKHFDLSEYDEALNDFKEGYRHKDDPVFLYNIAQCYRLLNKNDEAVRFYRNYLRRSPKAANKDEVEKKIETLQQAIAAQEKARTTPPTTTLKPGEVPPSGQTETHPEATTPAPAVATTPEPATPAPAAAVEVHAEAPRKTPVYKKWWLWTIVGGVAVVGLGVGLGVGLSSSSSPSGTSFPQVTF
jgi:tetratricopeptide (TPR) repeat protein